MATDTHSLPTVADIAGAIDHAILKPELTRAEVDASLDVAKRLHLFSVCVRPSDIRHAVRRLDGSGVVVGTVIGFPHGTTTTAAKVAEALDAVANGAVELDMVLNIGRLKSGLVVDVEEDIRQVVNAANGLVVKVILETTLLADDEIVSGCRAAEAAGADFVKTSTGFAGGGATPHAVELMRASVSDTVEIKASGGMRDLDALLALRALGATRFGTSGSEAILAELARRHGDSVDSDAVVGDY